jgi:hypothetical protein
MINALRRTSYRQVKLLLYGRHWPEKACHSEEGYTILVPIPADMPILLRFALAGMQHLSMPNCRKILVISDGASNDQALRTMVGEQSDSRVEYVPLTSIDKVLTNLPRSDGSANFRHFTQILRGVLKTTTEAVYLHDADAFWLDKAGVETQYHEFQSRAMNTLGLSSRIDPMFKDRGYDIPGTWELMFSRSWVQQRLPMEIKGGWYPIENGEWRWFDTLLFGQYMDYASGKFGVMKNPPAFVHFYGTITEYRSWQRAQRSQPTEDSLFNLLLLSVFAASFPEAKNDSRLPPPHEMARGLSDRSASITYFAETAPTRYASFRSKIEAICAGPVFGNVAGRVRELLVPFDRHFCAS